MNPKVANFYKDTPDLRRRIESAPWGAILPALEKDFSDTHELAPASLEEAVEQIGLVLELTGEIAAQEVAPHAAEVDRVGAKLEDGRVVYHETTRRNFELLGEAGLMGFTLPREYGGMNLPITAYTAAVEMMGRADASFMTLFALQGCAETICRFGDEEIRQKYLPRLSTGEITPCMALTEPDAGSALGSVAMRATPGDNGTWRLQGSKCFITNGGADILLTLARSEEGKDGGAGLSLFLVERGEGIEVAKLEEKLGIHGSATALINYDDAPGVLIGERGAGLYKVTMGLLHNVRLEVAAQAVGIAQAAQSAAVTYARERKQFGRSIDAFAPVRTMLFENARQIEAARAIIFTTAAIVDRKRGLEQTVGGDELERYEKIADLMTPLSKYYACEMVNEVTSRALQCTVRSPVFVSSLTRARSSCGSIPEDWMFARCEPGTTPSAPLSRSAPVTEMPTVMPLHTYECMPWPQSLCHGRSDSPFVIPSGFCRPSAPILLPSWPSPVSRVSHWSRSSRSSSESACDCSWNHSTRTACSTPFSVTRPPGLAVVRPSRARARRRDPPPPRPSRARREDVANVQEARLLEEVRDPRAVVLERARSFSDAIHGWAYAPSAIVNSRTACDAMTSWPSPSASTVQAYRPASSTQSGTQTGFCSGGDA